MKNITKLLSKKLEFDFDYALKGGSWIVLGHIFSVLAILATSYFFANFLDPHLYGNYRYLISASVILSLFSLSGIDTAIIQAVAKNVSGYFIYALRLSLKFGILTSIVAFGTATYYYAQDNNLLAIGFLIIGILQPVVSTSNLIHSYFYGKQSFNLSVGWHVLRTILTTASIVITLLLTNNVLLILLSFFASNLVANLIPYTRHRELLSDSGDKTSFKKFTNYAKHTSLQNIIIGMANQLDKVLIFQILGAVELATYVFATAIPDQYKGITKAVDSLLLPRFSKYNFGLIKKTIWKKTILYLVFLLIGAIIYIVAAPFIFSILYPTYSDAVTLSQIYALSIIFGFGSIPFTAMKAKMDNGVLYEYKLILAIFQIVSLVSLLNLFGIIGAIFARIIYRAFVCAYGYYLFFNMNN